MTQPDQLPRSDASNHDRPQPPTTRLGGRRLAKLRSQLPKHHLALLQSVGALHFATTRQLERLHFHNISKTPGAAARRARRCLGQLAEMGLVDQLDRQIGGVRAGSVAYIWRTTPAGTRLLEQGDRRSRSVEPSRAHLDHVLEVAELVVRLNERARASTDIDLLDVETEPACWRQFAGSQRDRVWLKPDLRVTLGISDRELHWFVELDRGSENRSALTRKAAKYISAWHDGGEQARAGVFPRVLWVVPDQKRAAVLDELCASMQTGPANMFAAAPLATAVDVLTGKASA